MPHVLGLSFSVYDKPIPLLLETSHCLVPANASRIFAFPSLSSAVSYTQWLFCVAVSTRHSPSPPACSHTVSSEEPDPCLSCPICDSWTKEIRAPTLSLAHLSRHFPVCLITLRHLWWKCPLIIFFFSFLHPVCCADVRTAHNAQPLGPGVFVTQHVWARRGQICGIMILKYRHILFLVLITYSVRAVLPI